MQLLRQFVTWTSHGVVKRVAVGRRIDRRLRMLIQDSTPLLDKLRFVKAQSRRHAEGAAERVRHLQRLAADAQAVADELKSELDDALLWLAEMNESARDAVTIEQTVKSIFAHPSPHARARTPLRGDHALSPERERVIEAMQSHPGRDWSPSQVFAGLYEAGWDTSVVAVRTVMGRMADSGQLVRAGWGRYRLLPRNRPS